MLRETTWILICSFSRHTHGCVNYPSLEFTKPMAISRAEPRMYTSQVRNPVFVYRVAQNHGKQVLRISCMKFHLLTFQFVVIPHGKRDLSSLPEVGEVAVQISWIWEAVGQLMQSRQGNSIFPVRFSKPAFHGFVPPCTSCTELRANANLPQGAERTSRNMICKTFRQVDSPTQ